MRAHSGCPFQGTPGSVGTDMPPRGKTVKRNNLAILLLLVASFASWASAANKGFVIAMGGGNGTPEIYEKWKALGGGTSAHVVLIPTANNPGDDIAPVVEGLKHVFGTQDVTVLDTTIIVVHEDQFEVLRRPPRFE